MVSSDVIQQFQEDGHVRLNSLLDSQSANQLKDIVLEAVRQARNNKHADYNESAMVRGTSNLWQKSSMASPWILSNHFAEIAAKLLGVEAVRLYHDAALIKPPGATGTGWHQDNRYMVFDRTITMWLALNDVPEEIGSLSFVPGSHLLKDLKAHDTRLLVQASRKGCSKVVSYGALNAGDATFHHGWTIHSAAANPTDKDRVILVVIYYPDGEPMLSHEGYETRIFNSMRWFPGGESDARGPLHPIVCGEGRQRFVPLG